MMLEKSPLLLPLFALGTCFMIGMIGSTEIVTQTLYKIKKADTSIEVKGYTERRVKSDYGSVQFTLSARALDVKEVNQTLNSQVEELMKFLTEKGVDPKDLKINPIDQRKLFKFSEKGQQTNEIEGYEISQRFLYALNDVNKISQVTLDLSQFASQGYDLQVDYPTYMYSSQKLETLKLEMIGDATLNGRQRAEKFLGQNGMKVGLLKSARQGVFQVSSAEDTNSGDYNTYDTRSIEKIIKVVVTLTYMTE